MPRFAMNKLVRDGIAKLLIADGAKVTTKSLSADELASELDRKMAEELAELQEAKGTDRLIEYADLLEVLYARASLDGFTPDKLEAMRLQKVQERGGFVEQSYISEIEVAADNPRLSYYTSQPHRFKPLSNG